MSKKPKVAVVGIGHWGKNLVREFDRQAELAYVYHRGSTANREWLDTNYPNVIVAKSYEQILTDPTIAAIIIATQINSHFDLARSALAADKHVWLEKPGTNTSEEMESLAILAKEKNLILTIGYIFVHSPAVNEAKRLLGTSRVESLKTEWLKWGTFKEGLTPNLLSHDLALAYHFGLFPLTITGYEHRGVETASDIVTADFSAAGGATFDSYINRVAQEKKRVITITSKQSIFVIRDNKLYQSEKEIPPFNQTPLEAEVENFLAAGRGDAALLVPPELAVAVLKTIQELEQRPIN